MQPLRIFCLLICALVFTPERAFAAGAHEQQVAPDFSVTNEEGRTVSLSQFRGKIVYLDFWASWCGPCRKTFPWMNSLREKFPSQDFQILAVNLDSTPKDAENFLSEVGHSFPIAFDSTGSAAEKFSPSTMPTSYLIGRDGKILRQFSGFHEEETAALEGAISKALATVQHSAQTRDY